MADYQISGRVSLTPDDEDEEKKGTPGRPNAWWAEHKSDVVEAGSRAATFDSAVRGVSQGPHGGSASVRPEDTKGSLTYCWCGLPFDHDWPGKERGRKHPRDVSGMTATAGSTQQRIERRQLRAYNDDLVDVIVEAVNGYGARYRMQKNGIVLFPPDGTQGITMNARSGDRQVKQARLWFLRHCVGVGDDGKPTNPLVADAEVLTEDHERRLGKVIETTREEAAEQLAVMKSAPDLVAEQQASSVTEPTEAEWVPYVDTAGVENEFFETDGTTLRCKVCKDTPDAYSTNNSRGIGGHIRIRHRDNSTMYSPEARAKAQESRRSNKLTRQVEEAITTLSEAIGYTPPADTKELDKLRAENEVLRRRAEDAEARLQLMKEALGA